MKHTDGTQVEAAPQPARGAGRPGRFGKWLEAEMLGAVAVIAGLLLGFVVLAGWVSDGATKAVDEWLMLSLRTPQDLSDPIGPKWLEEAVRDFTALGSTAVLTLLVISVSSFLAMTKRKLAALLVLGCTISGTAVSNLAKMSFARPRPELVPHSVEVYTSSFPSGHALMSAVVYLTLGVLIARTQTDSHVRIFILCFAIFLTLLVGVSRVYLGVHWPSDVLAGWCLGSLWAMLCWFLARRMLDDHGAARGSGSAR